MLERDVYANFLRGKGKIKVFPTTREIQPFAMAKKLFRRAYPFMLASAMVLTGCGKKQEAGKINDSQNGKNRIEIVTDRSSENKITVDTINYMDIYNEVVNKYNLALLKEKEPLSKEYIDSLIKDDNVPELVDGNYNHLPENKENFWNIVKNGVKISVIDVQNSPILNENQKKVYMVMAYKTLSQISKHKDSVDDVDLNDYNNLKAFLYFEKVVEYKDNYKKVHTKSDGLIDARHEVLGRYYEDCENLKNVVLENVDVLSFAESFYKDKNKNMILTTNDSVFCNKASYEILNKWMKEQDIKEKGLYYLTSVEDDDYCNGISIINRRGKDLGVVLGVDSWGELGEGFYAPVGEIIVHEMMHVMQIKPSSDEKPEDNVIVDKTNVKSWIFNEKSDYVNELGPSLVSLVIDDYLYKKMNNIPQGVSVNYGSFLSNGKEVKIGELAMWFRGKLDKYKDEERFSVDKMLAKPEVFKELKAISNGNMPVRFDYTNNYSR